MHIVKDKRVLKSIGSNLWEIIFPNCSEIINSRYIQSYSFS